MGKNPKDMPVLVEQFVAVGDKAKAEQAAELWRFIPKAFKGYHAIRDPAEIQRRAEAEVPQGKVLSSWPIGNDPRRHIEAIEKLFDSGATTVNIHAAQNDQKSAIEFYGSKVLPISSRRRPRYRLPWIGRRPNARWPFWKVKCSSPLSV